MLYGFSIDAGFVRLGIELCPFAVFLLKTSQMQRKRTENVLVNTLSILRD
jgi:hypothetical protein